MSLADGSKLNFECSGSKVENMLEPQLSSKAQFSFIDKKRAIHPGANLQLLTGKQPNKDIEINMKYNDIGHIIILHDYKIQHSSDDNILQTHFRVGYISF